MSNETIINMPSRRRAFLQRSCVAAGGIALGVAAGQAIASDRPTTVQASPNSPESKGYRVTQHVLDYYKTAAL